MPETLLKIFIFFLGTCVGSFLNVCIYRLPKGFSVVKPASNCPQCIFPIKWYDNIPIVSYLFLKARCRHCGERISPRYLIVELLTGLLFLFLYLHLGLKLTFLKYIFFFSLLIVVSFIDLDYHAIPTTLCFTGIAVGLAFSAAETVFYIKKDIFDTANLPLFNSFKGLIVALGFTYLFKIFGDICIGLYLSLRKKDSIEGERESLGLGDVDFMGMAGVFLGAKKAILVFFLAPFFGLVYSVFALIFRRSHLIPYLPYLSLATLVVFLWGDKILSFF